jgi:acetylornithine aminotransferase
MMGVHRIFLAAAICQLTMSIFFFQKPVIVSAEQSFHGRTLAALSATQQPKYHKGFGYDGKMVPGFDACKYNDIASLEAAVERATSNGQGLAAIMLEPLQGEGGIIPGNPEFFAKARELCDKHGALLMIDEVQAGMGRTGTLWGHENLGVVPDVFTSAKALGGGVPSEYLLCICSVNFL